MGSKRLPELASDIASGGGWGGGAGGGGGGGWGGGGGGGGGGGDGHADRRLPGHPSRKRMARASRSEARSNRPLASSEQPRNEARTVHPRRGLTSTLPRRP